MTPQTLRANEPGMLHSLTAIRAFAALAVVIHHTRNAWPHYPVVREFGEIGWLGVPLFFILSGFVLMHNFDPHRSWGEFVARRLFRIYPLHLVTLAFSLGFFGLTTIVIGGYKGDLAGTIMNVLLIHDVLPGHPEIRQAWNGVSWSLSCEFCFYLAAPVLFRALLSRPAGIGAAAAGGAFLGVLALAGFAAAEDWPQTQDFLKFHPLPHFTEFSLGAVAAILVRQGRTFGPPALALVVMAAPLALYFACTTEGVDRSAALTNYLFVPGALLLIASLGARDYSGARSWLHRPVLIALGDASFALYMTHALALPLFGLVVRNLLPEAFDGPLTGELVTLVFVGVCFCLSLVMHESFELPLNRRLNAWYAGLRGRSALQPARARIAEN